MGTEGKIDDVAVSDVREFEKQFLQYLRHSHNGVLEAIAASDWDDDIVASLDEAISHFKQIFLGKDGKIRVNEAEAEAMEEGVEAREKVMRVRRTPPKRP